MTAQPWVQDGNKFQRLFSEQTPLTTLYDFAGTSYPVYVGEAVPGTATGSALWRIQKRSYTSGRLVSIEWAEGDGKQNKIWNNRASYSYS